MRLTPPSLVLLGLLVTGCAASPSHPRAVGPAVPAPVVGVATTWTDGMSLKGTVRIPAGSTVTLAKGARVTAAKGSALVVEGTLLAPDGGSVTGAGWKGLTVGKGGSATLTGVTLTGGDNGVELLDGAAAVTLTGSKVLGAHFPLTVGTGSTLTLDHTLVSKVGGASLVKGTLVGRSLTYDQGSNPGIVINGSLRVSDSLLEGDGSYSGDMLTTSDAGEVTVTRTEVKGVHCAFHVVGVRRLTLDGLKIHGNAYGFMAYGSDPSATHTITASDVYDNRDFGLYESPGTTQGRILVDGGYWGANGKGEAATITQSTGKIERTHPRATR